MQSMEEIIPSLKLKHELEELRRKKKELEELEELLNENPNLRAQLEALKKKNA